MATVFFLQNLRVTLYVIFSNLLDDPTHLVTKHKLYIFYIISAGARYPRLSVPRVSGQDVLGEE